MGKIPIKINEYFAIFTDEEGKETQVIYNPPLLAESENIRIELRKEKNHERPHVHIIKKGRNKSVGLSLGLNSMDILVGAKNLKYFDKAEFQVIAEFLLENADDFIQIYNKLRDNL